MSKFKKRTKAQQALLVRVAKRVFRNQSKFDMHNWHSECGTQHCLAGWAFVLAKHQYATPEGYRWQWADLIGFVGKDLLGEEAHSHFFEEDNKKALAFLKGVLNETQRVRGGK